MRFYVRYQDKYLAFFSTFEEAQDFIQKLARLPDFNQDGFTIVPLNH